MSKPRQQTRKTPCEREYDFALILAGIADLTDEVMDAFFSAGCDDATFTLRYGLIFAEFSRSARSFEDAILSAIHQIRRADTGAEVIRVNDCDLVSASDIARRINRSRQLISQYIQGQRGPGDFPPPECFLADDKPLWAWCAVTYWLADNQLIRPDESHEADFVDLINDHLALERHHRRNPELATRLERELHAHEATSRQRA
jgi:hypothetical protein